MSIKDVFVVGLALVASGCSIGRPLPAVTVYRIEPPPAVIDVSRAQRLERLKVGRVRVAEPYDRASLVYRLSDVRFTSDPYHAFLADPGPMLGNRIAEWLADADLFQAVDGPGGPAPAPRVLEATVTELYGDFEAGRTNPAAVMSIHFTIINQEGPRPEIEYERSLSRRVALSNESPEALVRGYGAALADILNQLMTDLSNYVSQ
jgi:uncharacterized lipoprotein YmbA